MSMGYRGEDVSRDRVDARRQQPWQQSSATRPAAEEQWSEAPRGYSQANDGHGYSGDGYGQGDGYGYSGDGYGQGGGYGSGYERNGGYDPSPGPGGHYGPGDQYEYGANGVEYGADGGYGQNYEYGQGGEYGGGRGYGDQRGYGEQGYSQAAQGYGDDGNDWYGSQAPVTGGFAAIHDPVRGFPPAPGQFASRPQLPAAPPQLEAAPQGLVHTGQQEMYDDSRYESYPGYEGVADTEQPQGYDALQGYDAPGYNSTRAYDTTGGYDTTGYDTTGGYDTATYDTGQAESQLFATAPTYEDAVGYDQQGYDDYDGGNGDHGGLLEGQPGKAPKGGKRRVLRRVLLSAAGVVVVAAAVGAGYTFFLKSKQSANAASATGPLPSPGATSSLTAACQAQLGQYCHIEMRADDPKPLTLAELYPPQFFNETDHVSFSRVGTRLDKNCANAVIGPDLVSALQKGQCTQVLRASYVSGDHTIMGTVGVVNLNTTNGAHHAGKVVGGNDFISPLSAAHGLGSNLGKGTGVVQAEFKGHYLILTWAEFSNLKAPAGTAQDNALTQFENDLIAGTANISLSQRMINGMPATAGG